MSASAVVSVISRLRFAPHLNQRWLGSEVGSVISRLRFAPHLNQRWSGSEVGSVVEVRSAAEPRNHAGFETGSFFALLNQRVGGVEVAE